MTVTTGSMARNTTSSPTTSTLYRIEEERQLETIGFDELATEDAILQVEWGEKFPIVVKCTDGEILIEHAGGDTRNITLKMREKETAS
jgi:tRNA threonylcarbamoyladenosine biosynthesis protein TsaE